MTVVNNVSQLLTLSSWKEQAVQSLLSIAGRAKALPRPESTLLLFLTISYGGNHDAFTRNICGKLLGF